MEKDKKITNTFEAFGFYGVPDNQQNVPQAEGHHKKFIRCTRQLRDNRSGDMSAVEAMQNW